MTEYSVRLTDSVLAAIAEQARFIAVDNHAPLNAQRWLESIWEAVDSLEKVPRRGAVAEESRYLAFEVRQLIVGSHLLLFAVDDKTKVVSVLGLRHGHRLPRPGDLTDEELPDEL